MGLRNTKNRFFGANSRNCHIQSNGLCLTTEVKRDDESSNRKRHFRGSEAILVVPSSRFCRTKILLRPSPPAMMSLSLSTSSRLPNPQPLASAAVIRSCCRRRTNFGITPCCRASATTAELTRRSPSKAHGLLRSS